MTDVVDTEGAEVPSSVAGVTPMPWHVAGWSGSITGTLHHPGPPTAVWGGPGGEWLVAVTGPAGDRESEADARLIAAAPELLQALKAVLRATGVGTWNHPAGGMALRAVAKAEGRG